MPPVSGSRVVVGASEVVEVDVVGAAVVDRVGASVVAAVASVVLVVAGSAAPPLHAAARRAIVMMPHVRRTQDAFKLSPGVSLRDFGADDTAHRGLSGGVGLYRRRGVIRPVG